MKRKSSVLKTELVDATENETKILAKSIDRIHIRKMEMEERRAKSQKLLLYTQLEFFKVTEKRFNQTQTGMVTVILELTKVMKMAFLKVANTNDEIANGNTKHVDPDEDSADSL